MKAAPSLLLIALSATCLGQDPQAASAKNTATVPESPAQGEVEIPSHVLEFKAGDPISGVQVGPLISQPTQCSSDGTIFLDAMKVSLHKELGPVTEHTVYSIKGRKSHAFSASAISDLHEVQVISIFASRSMVAFLVNASKEPPTASPVAAASGDASAKKVDWSKRHYYIAKFDLDGSYKESVELPMRYDLFRLAVLSSGEFLVSGFDHVNSVPRIVLLGPKGDLVRTIELPASIPADGGATGEYGSIPGRMASSKLIGSLTFTSYGDDVLLWRRGGTDPVLDIGDGGSVRLVPLHAPKGYVLSDMVPANDRWIAHFRPAGWDEAVAHDSKDYIYYEVRPSDGSLSARLSLADKSPGSIACESDGTFLAYTPGDDGKVVPLAAN